MTGKNLEQTKDHPKDPAITAMPGQPSLMLGAYDVARLGYTTEEFFISGEATSYESNAQLRPDGLWAAEPAARAPYTSRIVVLRPTDDAKFNGTVLVEPTVWRKAAFAPPGSTSQPRCSRASATAAA